MVVKMQVDFLPDQVKLFLFLCCEFFVRRHQVVEDLHGILRCNRLHAACLHGGLIFRRFLFCLFQGFLCFFLLCAGFHLFRKLICLLLCRFLQILHTGLCRRSRFLSCLDSRASHLFQGFPQIKFCHCCLLQNQ